MGEDDDARTTRAMLNAREITRLKRLNVTLSVNLRTLASAALDGNDRYYDDQDGREDDGNDNVDDDDNGHFDNHDNDEDDDIDEISRLKRLNVTLSVNLGMLVSTTLDGDDHDYDDHDGRYDNREDDGHFDYDDERIREREATTAAADLWIASKHKRMARSHA